MKTNHIERMYTSLISHNIGKEDYIGAEKYRKVLIHYYNKAEIIKTDVHFRKQCSNCKTADINPQQKRKRKFK